METFCSLPDVTKLGPLPPVAGVCKVEFTGFLNGVSWACIMHEGYTGAPPTPGAVQLLANKFKDAWLNDIAPYLPSASFLQATTVSDLSSNLGAVGVNTTSVPGSRAGTALPNNCTPVISWTIARKYRGGHPRTYLPGINQADVVSGTTLDPTFITLLSGGASSFLASSSIPGAVPMALTGLVCVHYRHGAAYVIPPTVDTIVSGAAHAGLGTQRKRLT